MSSTPNQERIRRATRLVRQLRAESYYQIALACALIDSATDDEMDAIERILRVARERREESFKAETRILRRPPKGGAA